MNNADLSKLPEKIQKLILDDIGVFGGSRVHAAKDIREFLGCGLIEAKQLLDKLCFQAGWMIEKECQFCQGHGKMYEFKNPANPKEYDITPK